MKFVVNSLHCFVLQELSQEKQRTLELLGVKESEEAGAVEESSARRMSEDGEDAGDVDLLQDLRHIEEQMKVLLKEKEQADERWATPQKLNPAADWEHWFSVAQAEQEQLCKTDTHFTFVSESSEVVFLWWF